MPPEVTASETSYWPWFAQLEQIALGAPHVAPPSAETRAAMYGFVPWNCIHAE